MSIMKQDQVDDCWAIRRLIDAMLDGEWDIGELTQQRLDDHTSRCLHCKAELHKAETLFSAFSELPETAVPEDFTLKVMSRVREYSATPSSGTGLRAILGAAAASVALGVLALGTEASGVTRGLAKPLLAALDSGAGDLFGGTGTVQGPFLKLLWVPIASGLHVLQAATIGLRSVYGLLLSVDPLTSLGVGITSLLVSLALIRKAWFARVRAPKAKLRR